LKSTRASITTLLIGTAVLFLGYGLLITLLPLRARIEDFSTTMIGVMGGAYFAGFAVGCLIGPQAVKRVGHIRAFAGFAALSPASVSPCSSWWSKAGSTTSRATRSAAACFPSTSSSPTW
jgi:MFS family permease